MSTIRASRYMTWALRHNPAGAGITVDADGWTSVAALLRSMQQHGHHADLAAIVAADEKGRYSFSADGRSIRANYGHSFSVNLGAPVTPPERLFHGSARDTLGAIKCHGLLPGRRQYVHLAINVANAFAVGRRHGPPVVIPVETGAMHADGCMFYRASDTWLTEQVPSRYLRYDALIFDETARFPLSLSSDKSLNQEH